jgi:Spy/CpxP family protein refolding chaperone
MFDKLADELALSPEQRTQLRQKLDAQMKKDETAAQSRKAAAEKQSQAIEDAFLGDKFDAKKAGLGKLAPDAAKAMVQGRVTFAELLLSVLTPEQRAKFGAHLRARAADMD